MDKKQDKKLVWEENGIIMTVCVGGLGEDITKEFIDQFYKTLDKYKGKGRALIDGSGGGATRSSKIRKMYIEFGKNMRADKVAIFGANTFQKVVAGFIIKAISKINKLNIGKVEFFEDKEKALKWLKK